MNKMTTIILGCSILGIAACNQKLHQQKTQTATMNTDSIQIKTANNFAFDFFEHYQNTQAQSANIFLSPLSLQLDLGMLLNGASGNTLQQIQEALHQDGRTVNDINKRNKMLLSVLPHTDKKVELGLYNSIWYQKDFAINSSFSRLMKKDYNTDLAGLAFDEVAKSKINQWVSNKTNGKIEKVLDKIDPLAKMYLINALYFKGDWAKQFNKNKTQDLDFTLADGATKNVQMMLQTASFKYLNTGNYKAVELPYGDGHFAMTVLLPNTETTVQAILNGLSANEWDKLQRNLTQQQVKVGLPKFIIDGAEADLIPTLETMGMKDVFDPTKADLAKLSEPHLQKRLFVSLLKQFTYIKVDEQGTEAAAVTNTGISVTSMPMPAANIICNRPFAVVISERNTQSILFIGKIMNPENK